MNLKIIVVFFLAAAISCGQPSSSQETLAEAAIPTAIESEVLEVGADRWDLVLAAIGQRKVGCVVNHTSTSGGQHLVDRLLSSGVDVLKVFAPEHGFRGLASDGERVVDQRDATTGLPILSLYGKNKRPTQDMLSEVELLLFDIQDVGTRFYTYISTMHYIMEAGVAHDIPVLILDRPNPNGHYVDGPVLKPDFTSFIGMHPIPVVHGLTVGELAQMINGEGWLSEGKKVELEVIPVANYAVGQEYILPIRPSPNLPNQASIYLYPTLCFFEGTVASIGRGTDFPFQVVGHPAQTAGNFSFTPQARPGAKYAKLKGVTCLGFDLRSKVEVLPTSIDWSLLEAFAKTCPVDPFIDRPDHFDKCAGTDALREAFLNNQLAGFRDSYQQEVQDFLEQRIPYLLYPRA